MVHESPGNAGTSTATAPAVEATATALVELRGAGEVLEVPATLRDAGQLAEHLGVPLAAVATTAVLRTRDGGRLLVVASAAHPILPAVLAGVLSEPELTWDDDTDVLRCTGSVLGSASPIGLTAQLPTFVDVALAPYPAVWVPAGHPHAVFRTRYDELLRLTSGHPVEIG
ncbi:YbaK/prolyl-tRNA synthetase associated region [Kineococcus radiotolerans SRS30216 = ATCC BAA-149]|uniref:YbaK/prolyl-tRNA synthetase associated region n=1 Tax=Kineococcus radiotolerans (strain ATCC BAA-149 / DSM 14245 / SRS30216) TaxID=266940 RepID=A6WCZ5_KINRD|nr:YbaK/prolyl-tRNA synthetase associated region [Kineococcus radiotolerans SRS30216 = ATCC BAA-149]